MRWQEDGGDLLEGAPGLARSDVENLLQEKAEALEEAQMEVNDLEEKNKELLDKVCVCVCVCVSSLCAV